MSRSRKWRWVFVRLVLAASMLFALSGSAQEPATANLVQNPARAGTVAARDENSSSLLTLNDTGETNDQDPPPLPSALQSGDSTQSTAHLRNPLGVNPVTGLVAVSATYYIPLTGKQRLKVYWKQTYFSFGAYFKPVMFALVLDQTTNSPSEWGGGFSGFGLRVASRTASSMVQGTIRAPIAAALHEDVRYVYSGQHGRARRLLYAVEYSFLTYNNQHHPTLNVAKLVGYYASTAISTEWHSPEHSVAKYTFINGTEQLGLSVPINVLQEFWPYISHTLTHLH